MTRSVVLIVCALVASSGPASAQATTPPAAPDGEAIFQRACATCHADPSGSAAPSAQVLRQLAPEAILTALTTGRMRTQGDALAAGERRAVAEFLGGRPLAGAASGDPNRCTSTASLPPQLS